MFYSQLQLPSVTNYLNSLLKLAVKLLEKAVDINRLATELIRNFLYM